MLPDSVKFRIFPYESVDLAKTFPKWDSPLLSADYIYIQTFKDLKSVKKKLSEKEREAGFFNSEMNTKWLKLKKQQLDFLKDVGAYNKFFIENEEKCERINEKIESELAFQESCKLEIETYEERSKYLSRIAQKLQDSVQLLLPYNEFLESITADTEFRNVNDLINHYVLCNSETALHSKFSHNLLQTEVLHTQLLQSVEVKKMTISSQANRLFYSKKKCRNMEENLEEWTKKLHRQTESSFLQTQEMILMKRSCDNIYQRLCKWKKVVPSSDTDYGKKITFIGNTVDELRQIVQHARELSNKTDLSCEADSSFMTVKRMI